MPADLHLACEYGPYSHFFGPDVVFRSTNGLFFDEGAAQNSWISVIIDAVIKAPVAPSGWIK